MKDLGNYRKSYEKSTLTEDSIPAEPVELFNKWFSEAEQSGTVEEVNAMTLSTVGVDGFPKARIMLLKQVGDEGFIFFTNYDSEKGRAIAANPNVCLSFFWPAMERQVIIKGKASKTTSEISDAYFDSRPEGSKLGALASHQSEPVGSRQELEDRLEALGAMIGSNKIVRPAHWGGYIVEPVEVEFWQGRANRLHDRIRYSSGKNGTWIVMRLQP